MARLGRGLRQSALTAILYQTRNSLPARWARYLQRKTDSGIFRPSGVGFVRPEFTKAPADRPGLLLWWAAKPCLMPRP